MHTERWEEQFVEDDHFHDECGVIGVFGHPEAANLTYLGLYALQHRGQESAGIVSEDQGKLFVQRGMGRVADVFGLEQISKLPGEQAIGHVRYSTAGGSVLRNTQPIFINYRHGAFAVGHNGNLVNADELRLRLEQEGAIFHTDMDTEVIVHLLARVPGEDPGTRLAAALKQVSGAYSLVCLTETRLIGVRDPMGFRPLVLGRLIDSGGFVLASETCALDLMGAEFVRDIEPGELIIISKEGIESRKPFAPSERRMCVFEYIYFARPDSVLDGTHVYSARKQIGRALAHLHPREADVVVPVPDSGVAAAMGYAEASGLPFELGLIRNHYVGRTFIQPAQRGRDFGVKVKLNAQPNILRGKRVILVDDSIVRGTTSAKIVNLVRAAGAREVHFLVSSPPTTGPCYYGIDTPDRSQLIAAQHSIEEVRKIIGADSLGYISLDALYEAVGARTQGFCDACFSDDYPLPTPEGHGSRQLHLLKEVK
ncbi:amidophosphoribosyltransferase [Acidithiobacillus concretivorus]|uniref:Amidophosphoribosyltransferase n=1 Tax=Acidithiobacillus concretivorus TaxID=3063952 RepID=A0ABS5ZRZ7_9PROT|nr:amidophosphoribosyltransferase [Acidithiobacillus concretivorus]MBU2739361.1 amidophosphoribosyltransferase [Acidithiobacillus concretivorus]